MRVTGMTAREPPHHLLDELPDDQAELARLWIEDLRYATDEDGPPLDADAARFGRSCHC
jgi:hypothetical protein